MVLGLLKTKAHGFEQYLKEQYGSNFGPVLKELLTFKLKKHGKLCRYYFVIIVE